MSTTTNDTRLSAHFLLREFLNLGNQGDGSGDHLVWGICKKGTCHTIGEQYHLASLSNHSWKKWS